MLSEAKRCKERDWCILSDNLPALKYRGTNGLKTTLRYPYVTTRNLPETIILLGRLGDMSVIGNNTRYDAKPLFLVALRYFWDRE